MKPSPQNLRILGIALLCSIPFLPTASAAKKNPTSKLYVANLEGEAEIDTGERIEELSEKSVHNAQGTVIETKADSTNSIVFSNGTGMYFAPDTRLEVKRFSQEPFTPNRTDLEVEPSISQTVGFIPRGIVGLCAPKLVAGSSMNYSTPHGFMNIRGRKMVIEADDFETKVSAVEGEITVQTGSASGGGQTISNGQQAIIRRMPGRTPSVVIQDIPEEERQGIEEKVTMACNARRTVYFETADKEVLGSESAGGAGEVFTENDDEAAGADSEIIAVEVTPADPTEVIDPASNSRIRPPS